jgi:hypothetical protein
MKFTIKPHRHRSCEVVEVRTESGVLLATLCPGATAGELRIITGHKHEITHDRHAGAWPSAICIHLALPAEGDDL